MYFNFRRFRKFKRPFKCVLSSYKKHYVECTFVNVITQKIERISVCTDITDTRQLDLNQAIFKARCLLQCDPGQWCLISVKSQLK